jgi:hypothetical protein
MATQFRYQAFGLCLQASDALPGLPAAADSARTDLWVELAGTRPFPIGLTLRSEWFATTAGPQLSVTSLASAEGARFVQMRFGSSTNYAEFTINYAGDHVWVRWAESARFEDVVGLLLRPVFPLVLWLRGIPCLHASVVAVEGLAVSFMGPTGAGKSSLAAAFGRLGYPVLTDDAAAIHDAGDLFLVQPSFPSISMWPNTAQLLVGSTDLPPLWRTADKHSLGLALDSGGAAFRFETSPRPLGAVYWLGARQPEAHETRIEPIEPARGLIMLLSNLATRSYISKDHRIRSFELLSRMAASVPLREAYCPDDIADLPRACGAILRDLVGLRANH